MSENTVVINRGQRIFYLRPGPDGVKRELHPGKSIETLDDAEAKQLLAYSRDVADAANVVPANDKRIKDMQEQIRLLQADNERLAAAAQVKAETPEAPEPEAPKADEDEKPSEPKASGKKKSR